MVSTDNRSSWTSRTDVAVAGAVAAFAVVAVMTGGGLDLDRPTAATIDGPGALSSGAIALACGALLIRHHRPLLVVAVVEIARVVVTIDAGSERVLLPAVAVALYTATRRRALWPGGAVGVAVAVPASIVIAARLASIASEGLVGELLGDLAIQFLALAVGELVRARDEHLRVAVEREAAARVQAERLRIARDLHDVVAHGLSTIAVQSGVAAHLLARLPPDDAAETRSALDAINRTSRSALDELRAMVGVLRSTADAPLRPASLGPDGLQVLADRASEGGVTVELEVDGAFPAGTSESVVIALHRIVQEALTNVGRHAPGSKATVAIRHGAQVVEVRVANPLQPDNRAAPTDPDPAPDEPGSTGPAADGVTGGLGIVGMRERAEAVGGSMTAGPVGPDRFEVAASLPYRASVARR